MSRCRVSWGVILGVYERYSEVISVDRNFTCSGTQVSALPQRKSLSSTPTAHNARDVHQPTLRTTKQATSAATVDPARSGSNMLEGSDRKRISEHDSLSSFLPCCLTGICSAGHGSAGRSSLRSNTAQNAALRAESSSEASTTKLPAAYLTQHTKLRRNAQRECSHREEASSIR